MPESATALVNGLRFDDNGLIPAVVQDHQDATVLMVAWMDAEAVRRTLTTGRTWFWSRSRQEYWCKGESSGHRQYVRSVHTDCDADTLLVRVEQIGAACHNGTRSCFTFELPAAAGSAGTATEQDATARGAADAGAHAAGTAALARADDSGGAR
jgi:phosphoribosyl-AMP cyclohydrolase